VQNKAREERQYMIGVHIIPVCCKTARAVNRRIIATQRKNKISINPYKNYKLWKKK